MKLGKDHRWLPAGTVGAAILVAAVYYALPLATRMSEYGAAAKAAAAGGVVLGVLVASAVVWRIARSCSTRRRSASVAVIAALLLLLPFTSMLVPGKVLFSRFGFTQYGLLPVPLFDLHVYPSGFLGFRDKTHFVSVEEARDAAEGADVLVIGVGWDNAVRVDSGAKDLEGVEVIVLPTPEAFREFNRLKSLGRRVALLAHSTC